MSSRVLAAAPLLVLLMALGVWNAIGFAVDMGSLDQGPDSFGYLFGTVIISVVYGVPVTALVLALALGGWFVGPARSWAWWGSVLVGVSGLVLLAMTVVAEAGRSEAGAAFALATVPVVAVLQLPLLVCWLDLRREQAAQSLRSRT